MKRVRSREGSISFSELARRKTSLECDGRCDHDSEGSGWLHSCPMDDDRIQTSEEEEQEETESHQGNEAILSTQVTLDTATQTPELCTFAIGSDARAEAPTAVPLFSLFRPKSQKKVLVVIRHGESEFNASQHKPSAWNDPKLYDPSLTVKGCQQARYLRRCLAKEMETFKSQSVGALWVMSPLRRCIQTFLLSCPLLPETACDIDSSGSAKKTACNQVQEKLLSLEGRSLPPVRIVSHISERLQTSGDVGTAVSKLKSEFQPLQSCFDFDNEMWWHSATATCDTFWERESSQKMKERIAIAKRWLERLSEPVVFLYGHSVFWKAFFAQEEALRNCEYRLVHW